MKRTKLKRKSKSETARLKDDIQEFLRAIVILRDGGCILRGKFGHTCSGTNKDGTVIVLQCDHLIERSNSATYADSRLAVCICKGLHGWKHFKKSNHDQYNEWIKKVLPKERVKLWDRCEKDSWRPKPMRSHDWKLEIINLKKELTSLKG